MRKVRYIRVFGAGGAMLAPAWPPRGAVALRVPFEPRGACGGGLAFLNLGGESALRAL